MRARYSYDQKQDIVSYLWTFDDGNITSTMNPIVVHRYENSGIYNVSLRVVDAEGLNSTCSSVLCARMPTVVSFTTSTPSASAGYHVDISGTLLDLLGNRVANESVGFYYAYGGYENWNLIGSNLTNTLGYFFLEWIPPAPSYYKIRVAYAGNYTHAECIRNVTLSMLPYGVAGMFSVESNSTVSSMGFDAGSQTLSFTATGAEGTKGYAKVTAAKFLVPNLAFLRVYVDSTKCDFIAEDAGDSWALTFFYDHSVHLVEVRFDTTIPEFMSFTILMLFMAATLFVAMVYRRRTMIER